MTINTELFQKIYDQITQHPETHDQGHFEAEWHCGTTRCIAGWAVIMHYGLYSLYDSNVPMRGRITDSGYLSGTANTAAGILGLSDDQAHELFYEMNNEKAVDLCSYYANKGDKA